MTVPALLSKFKGVLITEIMTYFNGGLISRQSFHKLGHAPLLAWGPFYKHCFMTGICTIECHRIMEHMGIVGVIRNTFMDYFIGSSDKFDD